MKTIIAGSREITDIDLLAEAIKESGFEITEVVCGCARGVDTLGEQWAFKNSIPVKFFPASWRVHGKGAGFVRNQQMGEYADKAIVITFAPSGTPGSNHMIKVMKTFGKPVYVKMIEEA